MYKIVTMHFGSHLYGTNTPNSDTDLKTVFIPNPRDIILGRVKDSIVTQTRLDKSPGARNSSNDVDDDQISLQKFLKLITQGQPNALDMLFAPENMIVFKGDMFYIWQDILHNKHRLITRQAGSFLGYAREQANKYGIRGSRMGEAEETKNLFFDFYDTAQSLGIQGKVGDQSDILRAFAEGKEHCYIEKIKNPNGQEIEHFVCCNRKVPFTVSIKEAYSIYKKLYDAYGERAKAAKNNEGVDWKALSHAVRVGRQAIELAKTGKIVFPLVYADHLLEIKQGQRDFDSVSNEISDLLIEVEKAFEESSLPDSADLEWVDDFVYNTYMGVCNR